MTTKQVAKIEEAAVPAVAVTDSFDMLYDASGSGMQNVRTEDLAIPFLAVIQAGSPQRKKQDGAYITGADEGMVFNTVTQELFDITPGQKPITVLLCGFKKKLLHWKTREDGGGLLGQYDIDDPITKEAERKGGRMLLPDGTYLVETAEHFCLLVYPDGTAKRAVIAMSSTQLKKSRRWLTMVSEKQLRHPRTGAYFTPPPFAYRYNLSTQAESNDQGDWHGWKVADGGALDLNDEDDRSLFTLAQGFAKSIDRNEVKTSNARGDDHAADAHAGNGAARRQHDVATEDIPF